MNKSPLKTIVMATLSGIVGGAISGSLLGAVIALTVFFSELTRGDFSALFAIIPLGIYGALFGAFGGLIAGFGGGVLLSSTRFALRDASKLGTWLGGAVGAGVAGWFAQGGIMRAADLNLPVLVVYILFAALVGAAVGVVGGRTAGRMTCWLVGDEGMDSAEIIPSILTI